MKKLKLMLYNFLSNYYFTHYYKCCDSHRKRKSKLVRKASYYNTKYRDLLGLYTEPADTSTKEEIGDFSLMPKSNVFDVVDAIRDKDERIGILLRPTGEDDSSLINNAITTVSTNFRIKRVILDGVFNVTVPFAYSSALVMKSNVILEFMPGAKIVLSANNYEGCQIIICKEINNFEIINPYIIGDRDNHIGIKGEWGHGIKVMGCKNWKMYNIYTEKCWGDGVFIGNSETGVISEDGYINSIKSYKCRRNGTTLASGRRIKIGYIEGKEIDGVLPMTALDIENNGTGEVWEEVKIGKIKSHLCKGGVEILPFEMAKYGYVSKIDVEIDDVEITGNDSSNTGHLLISNVDYTKIKGRVKVGNLYVDKGNLALQITRVVNGGLDVEFENVKIVTSNNGASTTLGNRAAISIDVPSELQATKNLGNILIKNLDVTGDAEYLLNVIGQKSGTFEKSNLRIINVVHKIKKASRVDGQVHSITDNPFSEVNISDLEATYNPGAGWFTYHFSSTLYHNEGATADRTIAPASPTFFTLKETPITLENRTGTHFFGLTLTGKPIHPASLAFTNGFKSNELGARITFIQKPDDSIHILNRIGNWVSK
ncbi:hypothetical protein [Peribacillus butanolivorans]|uniref:hypothetical protein n=1 Tax=Peribacillus butanolivorans TaxID=421767 RepID=UPI003809E052